MTDTDVQPYLKTFLLCDDVRMEILGKISLLGFFPDSAVTLHPAKTLQGKWEPVLPSLAAIFILHGGDGVHAAKFLLLSPSGKTVAEAELGNMTLNPTGSAIAVCKGGALNIEEPGTYTASLEVGPWVFSEEISIKLGSPIDPFRPVAEPQAST